MSKTTQGTVKCPECGVALPFDVHHYRLPNGDWAMSLDTEFIENMISLHYERQHPEVDEDIEVQCEMMIEE